MASPPQYKTPQYQPGSQGTGVWGQVNDFFGSPAGQAAVGGVGSYFQQAQQDKQFQQNQALQQQQLANQERSQSLQAQQGLMEDQRARSQFVAGQRPIGEGQKYLNRQALGSQIFSQLQQPLLPGNPEIVSAMGTAAQPMKMDPRIAAVFEPGNVLRGAQSAITQRDMDLTQVDPNASFTDLGALGFDPKSESFQADTIRRALAGDQSKSRHSQMSEGIMQTAQQADAMQQARQTGDWEAVYGPAPEGYEYDEDTGELKKKGSSWWKKALAIGGAGVATALTGGLAAPALVGALGSTGGAIAGGALAGAAGGAVGNAIQGRNPIQGAMGGAMTGGLTGGIGAIPGAGGGSAVGGALKPLPTPSFPGYTPTQPSAWANVGSQLKNPANYLTALRYGGVR